MQKISLFTAVVPNSILPNMEMKWILYMYLIPEKKYIRPVLSIHAIYKKPLRWLVDKKRRVLSVKFTVQTLVNPFAQNFDLVLSALFAIMAACHHIFVPYRESKVFGDGK